ncbi:MAG: translation initiation factor [Synergistaceae bacterium]|nr:translation initiation factor [Synergistaceae bacterium]
MSKQKIDVNENLNVSIGELFLPEQTEARPQKTPNEKDSPLPSKKNTKPNISSPHKDIKELIPQIGKVSLQLQKAGRGGKTVTLISISEAKSEVMSNLEAILKELKKSLGCGGQLEQGKIVLQGEIADRASEWFVKMGAKTRKTGIRD